MKYAVYKIDIKRLLKRNASAVFFAKNCLSRASERRGLIARRFGEVFRSNFVVTSNRYIIQRKIEYAKKFLSSEMLTVSEVSEKCGFSDVYYFSKVFKKECGITPIRRKKLYMNKLQKMEKRKIIYIDM